MSEHAEKNARAHLESIIQGLKELRRADAIYGEIEVDLGDGPEELLGYEIRERLEQSALEVSVRSGWHAPGSNDGKPEEYSILLTTGGPALRVTGTLEDCEPDSVRLQHQDWGEPWTDLHTTREEDEALLEFARLFYYCED